jgi:hypothetical protein
MLENIFLVVSTRIQTLTNNININAIYSISNAFFSKVWNSVLDPNLPQNV